VKPLAENGVATPTRRFSPRLADAPRSEPASALEDTLQQVRLVLEAHLRLEDERLHERKLRALAEFAAGAAHEVNTPLAIISGLAQKLRRTESDPERTQSYDQIIRQAERIHALFRDLMLFARPPALNPAKLSLHSLVARCARSLKPLAVQRGVRLRVVGSRGLAPIVGDPKLLEIAVVALLRNALEAAPANGWARVQVVKGARGMQVVRVEDSGPGIAPELREHVFDPFYSGRSAGRGTGLGLSKAWRIAELHGGRVELPLRGCRSNRCELVLPIAPLLANTTSLNGQAVEGRGRSARRKSVRRSA
jgi:signal transduction histidine kinase